MSLIRALPLARVRAALGGQRRIAFVLSGGGSLGAVQVGMLRALVERGILPDVVVGCSVGAINGAAFAAEPGIRGLNRLDRIWGMLSDGDPDIMPSGRLPLAVQMARRGSSVFDPEILEQLLVDELGAHHFDELQLPFACVATSVRDADERWFEDGPLVPALMASAALPAVFPPVEIGGELFIDGGVVREAPVVQAADMGADVIYLLHVGHLTSVRPPRFERPIDVALHAYWMARLRRFEEDLEELGQRCTLIRLPSGSAPGVRFDDFSQGRALADRAHVATRHFLDTGETLEPVDIGTLEE